MILSIEKMKPWEGVMPIEGEYGEHGILDGFDRGAEGREKVDCVDCGSDR